MTIERLGSVLGALFAAAVLSALGVYVLRSYHELWGLGIGVTCILGALAIVVPVQLKAGAHNLKDSASDVHDAVVVIVPHVVDALPGGDRHTDPQVKP